MNRVDRLLAQFQPAQSYPVTLVYADGRKATMDSYDAMQMVLMDLERSIVDVEGEDSTQTLFPGDEHGAIGTIVHSCRRIVGIEDAVDGHGVLQALIDSPAPNRNISDFE